MSSKSNFYHDNRDLQFQLLRRADFATLFSVLSDDDKARLSVTTVDEYRALWVEMLGTIGGAVGSEIAGRAEQVEKEDLKLLPNGDVEVPPAVAANMKLIKELGVPGLAVDPRFGGMGAPFIVDMVAGEMLCRACPSTFLNAVWFGPIAEVIDAFGDEKLKQQYIPGLAAGEISGSMALTEPDAGSDLGALRTYGEEQPDGTWRVFGSKRFISNGCGDFTLCLAKNKKGAEGLKTLNLFLVPRKRLGEINYKVTKIEEKPGLHGSATCELNFDGSHAVLVGKDGEGFRYMLKLMNDARVGVGFQGLGMLEAIFRMTRDYATQRKAWGKPIAQHELIAEKLLDMEVDLFAMRSLCYQAAMARTIESAGERYLEQNPKLAQTEVQRVKRLTGKMGKRLRTWTPLMKWWSGEKIFVHARTGLQIHGGYGFTKEYKAEWWVRESLILSIYEGTSQIQALMCVKDTLKDVIRRPMEFAEVALGLKLQSLAEKDGLRRKFNRLKQITNSAIVALLFRLVKQNIRVSLSATKPGDILKLVKVLSRDLVKFENLRPALLHAERICEMKCAVHMARALLEDAHEDPSRAWIAERFMVKSLPHLQKLKDEIELDDRVLESRLGEATAFGAEA